MKTIELSGGFHWSPAVRIRVKDAAVADMQHGLCELSDILTKYQKTKLERHFCGIKGCYCGSYRRADIEILK